MQSKVLINRLKKLERKAQGNRRYYVFFRQPSKAELAKLPPNAKLFIFVGEDRIAD